MSFLQARTQTIVFWICYLLNLPIVMVICLNSARLQSINAYAKKMVFLFLFSIYYIAGKTIFENVHTLIATALPLVSLYIIDYVLGGVLIIGLTGGIACGKSTLVKYMNNRYDMKIIDCDQISKKQRLPGGSAYKFIQQTFGPNYIDPITKLVKNDKLGQLVFKDEKLRKTLTVGTGKFIMTEIARLVIKYIVSDAPILFQTKILQYFCYPIITVWVDQQEQVKRLNTRNGFSKQQAIRRIKSQMPINQKIKKSSISLKNQSTPETMFKNVDKALQKYLPKK